MKMAYTIRTAQALALVSAAAEVGIVARFVKDGEFFILQTREEGSRTYSHVYDDSTFEDVASTLSGMIQETKNKAETVEATDEAAAMRAQVLAAFEEQLAELQAATYRADAPLYVVRHGGIMGLYLDAYNKPVCLSRALVCGLKFALSLADKVTNGAEQKGEVVQIAKAYNDEIQALQQTIETLSKAGK